MTESNVQPFEFRGNPVATVTTGNGTVLFCAKHVATALGYSNTRDAIAKHCKGVANRYPLETAGGIQQMVFITEGDVYHLIASSKLTSAVEFEHWLFDEAVPQIRRTGGYIPQGETPEETMARAVLIAQKTIESSLDGWPIAKVASFPGVSKGSLYVWSCHDKRGGRHPPAPKRVGRRLVWNPQEVIDYRGRRCAISRKEPVHGK